MEVTVTKPIEDFIQRQISKGYGDVNEVTRQAFLRWMEEEDYVADPEHLRDKLDEARRGKFHPHNPRDYDALIELAHELSR
jgi:Arc/MetJ-type ribon-helix-helix transcriptional regulator